MLKTVGNLSTRYGDQTVVDGNLVFGTADKGIDFSANASAPGAVSELFNDYETGTWVPTLVTSGTNFTSVTYDAATGGRYTKIGNVVHIQGYIRTDAVTVGSASGDVRIGNLPYSAIANNGAQVSGNGSIAVSRVSDWAVDQPSAARVNANANHIDLYKRATANGASVSIAVADVGTGTDDNTIYFAGTYIAS